MIVFCFSWAENSRCSLSEKNSSIDVLIKYMTHEVAEIRTAVYCSIAMLVAVREDVLKGLDCNERENI